MLHTRVLFIRRGCPFCREAVKVVEQINMRLPIHKRIIVWDNFLWEEFGINRHPLMDKFAKDGFDAYPFLFLDGAVWGEAQKLLLKASLEGYLNQKGEFLF